MRQIFKYIFIIFMGFIVVLYTSSLDSSLKYDHSSIVFSQNNISLEIDKRTNIIDEIIKDFRTNDFNKIYNAQEKIINLSSVSADQRAAVIKKLILFASNCPQTTTVSEDYNQWSGIVSTLGKLKATESIEVLGNCLNATNGVGNLSSETYPAQLALFQIGKPSIPYLKKIIEDSMQKNKYSAILLLAKIGDDKEKKYLTQLKRKEKEKLTINIINEALYRMQISHNNTNRN